MNEAAAQFNGVEIKDSIAQIEALLGTPLQADFVELMHRRLDQAMLERLEPVAGVSELIRTLRVPYCIASNAPLAKIELALEITGLRAHFRGEIHSAYQVGAWKPDPALFLHAARGLGLAPDRCLVVEDSMAGIRAGVAAGMTVFAYQPHAVDEQLPRGVQVFAHFADLQARLREAGLSA